MNTGSRLSGKGIVEEPGVGDQDDTAHEKRSDPTLVETPLAPECAASCAGGILTCNYYH